MSDVKNVIPAICAVGKNYQFLIKTDEPLLVCVEIANKKYHSHSNGIKISSAGMHKINVPQDVLDSAREYTLILTPVIDRAPYFPKLSESVETKFAFYPITKTSGINICHLSDVHGEKEKALAAAENEKFDLLVLNGDISSTSNTDEDMLLPYTLATELTRGEIPCVISRGNHDLRGYAAERLEKYMPNDLGKSYYTFRVGCVWGILVDAGEDKPDGSYEYNGVICCEDFRREEDEAIKRVIENAKSEYGADGVKYKLVISHIPFPFKRDPYFDIERELYASWGKLLKDNVKPNLMLCGHTHKFTVSHIGSAFDSLGQPCTAIVASDITDGVYSTAFVSLNESSADVKLYSGNGLISKESIKL